ncbi:MAG: S-methyl-5'-thioadenosine phosphorylase [Candidatus Woesearchaeota archaeon]|nr:S-methyl-5'-thioadenosine phosphorylase [Candidatus Woesearchaeota archaeon]
MDKKVLRIGIIGGTGVYDPNILKSVEKLKMHTPYGAPSDFLTKGILDGKEIIVLPRHGEKHILNPSNVNYLANIWAMKELGVKRIFSVSAVGSLKEDVKPGELVFPDQFIDLTKFRKNTFYDGQQVCHVSSAEPFCPEMRKILIETAEELSIPYHPKGTCVVIEGPRFSSRAESAVFRSWNADIINMTMFPEVILARESEICYANISMVTDYDAWKKHAVANTDVLKTMKENIEKVRIILSKAIPKVREERKCVCSSALKDAMM